jgi:hypothetical protein
VNNKKEDTIINRQTLSKIEENHQEEEDHFSSPNLQPGEGTPAFSNTATGSKKEDNV